MSRKLPIRQLLCLKQLSARKCSTSANLTTAPTLTFDDIPTAKGWPIIGNLFSLLAAGSAPKLHYYVDKRHKELGPIFKEAMGSVTCIFVSDPMLMRTVFAHEGKYPIHFLPEAWTIYNKMYGCHRGLFFMDGPEWLHHRRIMNRLLLRGDLTYIDSACKEVCQRIVAQLNQHKNDQEFPDLEQFLYKWSLDIIIAVLLGKGTYSSVNEDINPQVSRLAKKVCRIFRTTADLDLFPVKWAAQLGLPKWKRFKESVDDALTESILLMQKLMSFNHNEGLLGKMMLEQIGSKELSRIVSDLILAAGDTTAYSMEWMLYLIAKHPEIQNRLRNDLNQTKDGYPVLLRNVLKETLRLYPVAPFLTRIIPEPFVLGKYTLPAGSVLILSIFTSGRNVNIYPQPEEFNPDRWRRTAVDNNNANDLRQHAILPFAIGARSCIGRKVAETQLQMTLSEILQNFHVELCNKQNVDVILKLVAVPADKIRLKFRKL